MPIRKTTTNSSVRAYCKTVQSLSAGGVRLLRGVKDLDDAKDVTGEGRMWNVKGVIEPFGCVCAMRRTAGVDCARSGCRPDGRPVRRWFEGGVSTVMCRSRLSGTAGGIEEIVAVRCVVDAPFDKYSFSDAALQGSRPKGGERFRFSCCPTSVSGLTAGFGCRVVPYRFEQSQIVSGSFRLLGSVPSFFKLFCTASGCLGMFRAAWGVFRVAGAGTRRLRKLPEKSYLCQLCPLVSETGWGLL